MEILKIAISILPVFCFLAALIFLDSYKLVRFKGVLASILAGCAAALIAYGVNRAAISAGANELLYKRYGVPLLEEVLKASFIFFLIRSRRIGFMVDGAIHGFAVGAGFALIENIQYLLALDTVQLFLWVIRGFGTAVMHGGTTAVFAILAKTIAERRKTENILVFLPGLFLAFTIHSFFNHGFVRPIITTMLQLVTLPLLVMLIFNRSEQRLRDWLEVGLDTDVSLLEYVLGGNIAETRIGQYFRTLKDRFPGEVMADMLCFLRIHLELAIRAKGFLMLQGAGFHSRPDKETEEKFEELKFLEKSIGKTGKLAMAPLLHNSTRDLWQLYFLEKK